MSPRPGAWCASVYRAPPLVILCVWSPPPVGDVACDVCCPWPMVHLYRYVGPDLNCCCCCCKRVVLMYNCTLQHPRPPGRPLFGRCSLGCTVHPASRAQLTRSNLHRYSDNRIVVATVVPLHTHVITYCGDQPYMAPARRAGGARARLTRHTESPRSTSSFPVSREPPTALCISTVPTHGARGP